MVANGLDLQGRVSINATPAITQARRLAGEFTKLSAEGKVGSAEMAKLAQTFKTVGAAANAERASIAGLAKAQAAVNKQMAEANVIQEKANAVKRNGLASAYTTRQKGKAVISGAADKTLVAEGQAALLSQRALTEEIRRTTLAEDAQGRAAVRASQIASRATQDRIAQERLLLAQQRATMESSVVGAERAATAFGHVGSAAAHLGATTGLVFAGIIANAVLMDREFASVVRTSAIAEMPTNTIAQVKAQADAVKVLKGQFDALAESLPISYKELTEIGSAANQLGIQSDQLANFTQAVAQFSATTGVSVDTASTAFGRLDSLVIDVVRNGKTIKGSGVDHDFVGLADAINKVGVNSVATDQQIISIASQIAGIANTAGLGYKEIVGFSGALASVGTQPFLARGLTTRLFTNIISAVDEGGKKLDAFAKVSGLTSEQFAQQWNNNPGQTLIKLMHGVAASGSDAINVLKDIGVKSILDQPALLKLARAADSNGTAFGLLAQTMRDANDAAGENAKQYTIIANTVQARLQVGLNRAQIALRDIAESDMGPLTQGINNVSKAVLQFGQGLDKPFKLFGLFETQMKNSQVFGAALLGVGAVAGLALLTAAGAKLVATFLRVRDAVAFAGANIGKLGANMGLYTSEAARAAAATEKLAAAQSRLAATRAAATLSTNAVTPKTSAFATAGGLGYAAYAQSAAKMAASNNRLIAGFGNLAQKGNGAALKAANGINRLGAAARSAGGAVSNLVGGPLGLLVIGGALVVGGFQAADAAMKALGTSAGDASVKILAAHSALEQINSIQISTQDPIGALFDKSTTSFGKQVGGVQDFQKALEHLGGGGVVDDFGAKLNNIFDRSYTGFNTLTTGLDKLDDGFQTIADSGNLDGAVKGIQQLFKGQSDSAVLNGLAHMDSATSILTTKLQAEGKAADPKNIRALAQGHEILSKKERATADASDAITKAFQGNTEAAADFTKVATEAGAKATDLNAAFQQASKGGKPASFGAFVKQADQNYKDFQKSQENAVKIAADTGADLTRLSALDPHILAGAIASGKKGEKELARVMSLQDAVATFNAAMAQLGNDPGLYQKFAGLGKGAKAAFLKTLHGGGSLEEAFMVTLDLDTQKAMTKAEATGKAIDAIQAVIAISSDPSQAIAKGESAQEYVDGLKSEFPIFANNIPAVQAGESAQHYIDRLKGTMTADADNGPGIRKGETLKAYIDRLRGTVKADAATAGAEAALNYLARPRTATVVVNTVGGGNGASFSDSRDSAKGGRATGGWVYGPGTQTSDSIPINVSKGEYIVRAAAAAKNAALLEAINGPSPFNRTNKFANGGFVKNSAGYEGTYVSRQSEHTSRGPAIVVTELSAYDRKLLVDIRESVGLTLDTGTVSSATATGFTRQNRRGNG
jgi:TP901 family phage tail tape measure protein